MRFLLTIATSYALLLSVLTVSGRLSGRERRKAAKLSHSGYGAPPPVYHTTTTTTTPPPVDLHNKEFCVDVSAYQPVVWEDRETEECDTVFVKKCEEKQQNVCATVTETRCEVRPYTECSLGMEPQQFNRTVLSPKLFVEKKCKKTTDTVPHTKYVPECRNVTKQNCVTNWETDKYGKQVWAGTEACEPVTWQDCKLVPKEVEFVIPKIICSDAQEVWYHEPEPVTNTRMTNTFNCEVKSATHCEVKERPDCKPISFQECREVPVYSCTPSHVHAPTQEKLHRKKCLLPDSPVPQYQPTYQAPNKI